MTSPALERPSRKTSRKSGVAWWGPALLALALYLPTIRFGFVWDDTTFIARNHAAQSWSELSSALGRGYGWTGDSSMEATSAEELTAPPRDASLYYRPSVTAISGVQWITGRGAAWPFHLLNAILHAASAALVTLIAHRLMPPRLPSRAASLGSLSAGLLFASHPIASEAVAWISGRTDLLATTFGLASLAALWSSLGHRWSVLVAGVALALALGSKESALAFVAAWTLVLWFSRTGRPDRGIAAVSEQLPLPAISARTAGFALIGVLALSLAFRWSALGGWISSPSDARGELADRLAQSGALVCAYALRVAWPAGLDVEAPSWVREHPPFWISAIGALLLAGLVLFALRSWRVGAWAPAVGLSLAFFGLAPILQWIPTGELFAERFIYLPLAGLALAAAPGLGRIAAKTWGAGLLLAVVVVWCVLGSLRIGDWRSERELFSASTRTTPESARAWANLGGVFLAARDPRAAVPPLQRAVTLDPGDPWKRAQLGAALVNSGDPAAGAPELEKAAAELPSVVALRKNLAIAWIRLGKTAEAIALLQELRGSAPTDAGVSDALAGAHRRAGDFDAAVRVYDETLALDPTRGDAYLNLISLLMRDAPDTARARVWAHRFVERFPESPQAEQLRRLAAE